MGASLERPEGQPPHPAEEPARVEGGLLNRSYFGTDGIRGTANCWPMTPEIALRVGIAAGNYFTRGDHRHRVLIGKDTRLSGYMLEAALTSGFTAVGMDVVLVGPMPTPAIAMLTQSLRADLGVMISASHNPFQDNGIKLFGPDGFKLGDEIEGAIEERMDNGLERHLVTPDRLGRAFRLDDAEGRYIEFVKRTLPGRQRLNGLKVVLDCANGAAYKVAPTVLWELEAEVIPVGTEPNGFNINQDCGSTAVEAMCAQVVEQGADIGIALDGDADRVVLASEDGQVVDGDQLIAAIADAWHEAGLLRGGAVVATVMSNLGLERYLAARDLPLQRTRVGDRYVVEQMRTSGCNLGGEQSGHIILGEYATTGDGLIAALQILALIASSRRPVSEVCRRFDPLPQVLRNVRYQGALPLDHPDVAAAVAATEQRLNGQGRLLIRPSGTEPVIRIMAEGEDAGMIAEAVDGLASVVASVGGARAAE